MYRSKMKSAKTYKRRPLSSDKNQKMQLKNEEGAKSLRVPQEAKTC